MGLKRSRYITWIYLLFVLSILLFSESLLYGQWKSVNPPTMSGSQAFNGVHFTSANEGWAVGSDYNDPIYIGALLHYQDGLWTSVSPPAVSDDWELRAVHFTSANEGWAVGFDWTNNRGVLLHYQSGLWTSIIPPAVSNWWDLRAVHFTSANEGWAVGTDYTMPNGFDRGVLLHYQNGVWTSVIPPDVSNNWELSGIHFTSANEGWAVGTDRGEYYRGVLLQYQNGVWTSIIPPDVSLEWGLSGVHFTSPNEGWSVGDNEVGVGALLHYQDGLWTSVIPPNVSGNWWGLGGVHFTSLNEGWAVGNNYENSVGLLLHYQDGLWTVVAPPIVSADWGIQGTYFVSPNDGWVVGYDWNGEKGVLLHYHSLGLWPNEGTIGTQVTLSGTGFGEKKGKVLIGGVTVKIAKDGWKADSIACTVTKVPSVGTHDVIIKPYKADEIVLSNAFTIKPPEIEYLDFYHGVAGVSSITISGNFFSTKKGKVYLEYEDRYGRLKKKNCKVTSWGMDSITFIVPKTSKSFPAGTYPLKVTNKVGTAGAPSDFTID